MRMRSCQVCGKKATWAIMTILPAASIDREGVVTRLKNAKYAFFCDDHIDWTVPGVDRF